MNDFSASSHQLWRGFLFGVVADTYSSIFLATSLLVALNERAGNSGRKKD